MNPVKVIPCSQKGLIRDQNGEHHTGVALSTPLTGISSFGWPCFPEIRCSNIGVSPNVFCDLSWSPLHQPPQKKVALKHQTERNPFRDGGLILVLLIALHQKGLAAAHDTLVVELTLALTNLKTWSTWQNPRPKI